MNVHKLRIDTPRLFPKNEEYEPVFGSGLTEYFKGKNYGEGVKEILFIEMLVPDELDPDPTSKEVVYEPEVRKISCIIQPDYSTAVKTNIKKYGSLISRCYLERSQMFHGLTIKDFDVLKFNEDLKKFFELNNLV